MSHDMEELLRLGDRAAERIERDAVVIADLRAQVASLTAERDQTKERLRVSERRVVSAVQTLNAANETATSWMERAEKAEAERDQALQAIETWRVRANAHQGAADALRIACEKAEVERDQALAKLRVRSACNGCGCHDERDDIYERLHKAEEQAAALARENDRLRECLTKFRAVLQSDLKDTDHNEGEAHWDDETDSEMTAECEDGPEDCSACAIEHNIALIDAALSAPAATKSETEDPGTPCCGCKICPDEECCCGSVSATLADALARAAKPEANGVESVPPETMRQWVQETKDLVNRLAAKRDAAKLKKPEAGE